MKKEKANAPAQKQSVNDFAHRLTIQLTEQHYVDYAMTHSQDQIQKGRKRAILWAVLFTILGLVAIYKGTFTEGWLADIYLIAGILMIVFQIFNLFYNFVMFPIALKRSVLRELKKDPSLLEPMEYAFEPDKLVCFLNGRHRSSILTQDIVGAERIGNSIILQVKDGRRVIIPDEALKQADSVILDQVDGFKNLKSSDTAGEGPPSTSR